MGGDGRTKGEPESIGDLPTSGLTCRDVGNGNYRNEVDGGKLAYQATVIPVMIASPGDVLEARDIARDVIFAWNDVNSAHRKTVLMPVGWETHSSPELGSTAQDLINERILADCDLLVGIFWTRLGTPTESSASGSAEEIERHVQAGKPAMVYFSTAPVAPESLGTQYTITCGR
jgi:hypothetical protein